MMFVETAFIEDCERNGVVRVLLRSDQTFLIGSPGIDDFNTHLPLIVRDHDKAQQLEAQIALKQRTVPQGWTYHIDEDTFTITTDASNIPVENASLYCLALPTGFGVDEHSVIHAKTSESLAHLVEMNPGGSRQVIVVSWVREEPHPFSIRVSASGFKDPAMASACREVVTAEPGATFRLGPVARVVTSIGENLLAQYIGRGLLG